MDKEPLQNVNVVELITDGPVSEYEKFVKEEGLQSLWNNLYFNVEHLQNLLEVPYVPFAVYLSPEGTIVNVSPASLAVSDLQRVIDKHIK